MKLFAHALVFAMLVGCKRSAPPEPFPVSVKVEADPGRPMSGVSIARDKVVIGVTGADGQVTMRLAGAESDVVDLVVTCPDGFTSPGRPLGVRLARLSGRKIPQYTVHCPPSLRKIVIAVRAENGPNLPVTYLNQQITRTDSAGAASFALEVPPGTTFSVSLSTAERQDLKPVSPSKQFVVKAEDDVFLFDQHFESDKKKRAL